MGVKRWIVLRGVSGESHWEVTGIYNHLREAKAAFARLDISRIERHESERMCVPSIRCVAYKGPLLDRRAQNEYMRLQMKYAESKNLDIKRLKETARKIAEKQLCQQYSRETVG